MADLVINLPKKLESQLTYLEAISQRPKDFHIKEALIRYLEDLEDLRIALKRLEKEGKTYTSEEVREKLNLK
jgi:RHH-type transcriptional regulator, rel operon repressor / antitoxin RelB